MNRFEVAAAYALPWAALVVGLAVLVICRRRAPGAVGFAAPVVVGLTLVAAVPSFFMLGGWLPQWAFPTAMAARPWVLAAGWTLLAVAVMKGRSRGSDVSTSLGLTDGTVVEAAGLLFAAVYLSATARRSWRAAGLGLSGVALLGLCLFGWPAGHWVHAAEMTAGYGLLIWAVVADRPPPADADGSAT